jgi:hypothetical protein
MASKPKILGQVVQDRSQKMNLKKKEKERALIKNAGFLHFDTVFAVRSTHVFRVWTHFLRGINKHTPLFCFSHLVFCFYIRFFPAFLIDFLAILNMLKIF